MRLLLPALACVLFIFSARAEEITNEQKDEFLTRLRAAVSANSADQLAALKYTKDIPDNERQILAMMDQGFLKLLHASPDSLQFGWGPVSPEMRKSFDVPVFDSPHQPSLEPEIELTITLPKDAPGTDGVTFLSRALGVHEGRLYIVVPVPRK